MAAARGTGKEAAGEREHQAVQAGTRAARRARGRAAGTAPGGTVQGARPVRVDLRGYRAAARRPVERQTVSRDRGIRLQNALARYLAGWWPSAESAGSGRPGTDVLGTPGIAWENKTAREFRPGEWVRQARAHAATAAARRLPLPVVV